MNFKTIGSTSAEIHTLNKERISLWEEVGAFGRSCVADVALGKKSRLQTQHTIQ